MSALPEMDGVLASAAPVIVPRIETARLVLRGFREDDLDALAAFYADEQAAHYVGGPRGRDDAWRLMAMQVGAWQLRGYGQFCVADKASDAYLGWCGVSRPEGWPEPELGYAFAPAAHGRGLATEAARAARDFAYRTIGLTTLVSYIDPDNLPSRRLAERLGAVPEGRQIDLRGSMVDVWRHPGPAELAGR
ncbi:GNAT family N-acetyltransferase [Salinarimonas ramus]|uniref:N-acetyltransferase n=1 Tax=Salinarimonas ramus TaxID=690164 RepID=A0A917V323_9HYPH|nr:GNAT family N-acetyltransferase [Salinarimonas ramus]GGK32728.1 N-acetyltransferase [Salinarimonas ramus]